MNFDIGAFFRKKKTVVNIQVLLKSDKNNGYCTEDQYTYMIISRSVLLRMRNVLDKRCRENQNTHFMFNNCFSKIVPLMRYCGKHCRSGQATDDNMAYAHCMRYN